MSYLRTFARRAARIREENKLRESGRRKRLRRLRELSLDQVLAQRKQAA